MNLHLLRLFVTVADQRSFSRAADVLSLTQPAVSKGVREFEAQLGAPLLERRAGGVTLTEIGALLLRRGREIFAAESEAEDEIRAWRGLEGGRLRIAASTTIATYFLPPYLAAFARAHPHVSLSVVSANTAHVAELAGAREVDVALVEGPVAQDGLESRFWRTDELALIAAPSHPLGRRRGLAVKDLEGELFILREHGSGTREVVLKALAAAGVAPVRRLEIGSGEAITRLVASGLGIAVVSLAIAADQIALGKLRRIRAAGLEIARPLFRLSVRHRAAGPAATAFDRLLDGGGARLRP